jgi:hypothetical protein
VFEKRCDISSEFFVDGRETPKSIQLRYVIPKDKLERALTGPARIKINGKFYRLFSKCPYTYKLNIFGFSHNALTDESKIRNACQVFGSNLQYLFIPTFVNARGQKVHYDNVVAIYSERPKVIDFVGILNRVGLRVNIQYPNRTEALRERAKRKQKGIEAKNPTTESSNEPTINRRERMRNRLQKEELLRKRM